MLDQARCQKREPQQMRSAAELAPPFSLGGASVAHRPMPVGYRRILELAFRAVCVCWLERERVESLEMSCEFRTPRPKSMVAGSKG